MKNTPLYSLEVEKNCIAGLMKYPRLAVSIPDNITASDFYGEIHRFIFPFILKAVKEQASLNPTLLADHIKQTGYSPKIDLSIQDYLDSLALLSVASDDVLPSFKELKKYAICRDLMSTSQAMQEEIRANLNEPVEDIVEKLDILYGNKLDIYQEKNNEFVDVFGSMRKFISDLAENPVDDKGIPSPFPIFNKYYGGFRDGNVYVWASRAKQGKSTLLSSMAYNLSQRRTPDNRQVEVLYLDTEMETKDFMLRQAAAISGVPFWYIDTGNFKNNSDYNNKLLAALREIDASQPHVYHIYVANKNIDQIISLINRWFYQKCKEGKSKPVIIYDYLKLTGEKISDSQREHQVIGDKVNKLKETATKIQAPLLTAIQINRTGITTGKDEVLDDESVIAMSDRISWFASFLAIFRRNSRAEVKELGGYENGTHRMVVLNARFEGRESQGHGQLLKKSDGSWEQNHINFLVDNFQVSEKLDLKSLIEKEKKTQVIDQTSKDEDTELF